MSRMGGDDDEGKKEDRVLIRTTQYIPNAALHPGRHRSLFTGLHEELSHAFQEACKIS